MKRIAIEERHDWKTQAESLGFKFHTIDGEKYWDESAYYEVTLQQVDEDLEPATVAVHDMALDLVADIVDSEELLTRLNVPASHWDWIRQSWKAGQPHLYGRMDFAYDGTGPAKLYELNYDTPTSLYEAAYFQWLWLEQQLKAGRLPAGADQFNSIQEQLILHMAELARREKITKLMHFAAVKESEEDQATVRYLQDCAEQAGIRTANVALEDIGISDDALFTDLDNQVIRTLFKLYPLEDMMGERFGAHLPANTIQLLEPAWKAVLSNKGILPLLWERHTGHPNLLPAIYADAAQSSVPNGWVRKPLHSREGANIEITTPAGEVITSDGDYGSGPAILQAYHPLTSFAGNYPLIGSWVIADEAAGIGIREDATLITQNTSRFVPHAIVG